MVERFLPSMRALVARRLSDDGLSQGRIAGLLGLTQASVSSYLSSTPKKHLDSLSALGVSGEDAQTYASLLAEDLKNNPTYAVSTLYSVWARILGAGEACALHRSEHPFLATCDMCMKTFSRAKGGAEGPIEQVEAAVRLLEGSSLFVHVMPEVSVNLAFAPEGARSASEVVAVPGRIVRVRGRARSFMKPEYGASTHLAAILLEVARRESSLRAAVNLRYDKKISGDLAGMDVAVLTIGRSYPKGATDKVLGALRERLASSRVGAFDAVVDLGGEGVEPSLYLFAEDPPRVAEKALRLARAYVAG